MTKVNDVALYRFYAGDDTRAGKHVEQHHLKRRYGNRWDKAKERDDG